MQNRHYVTSLSFFILSIAASTSGFAATFNVSSLSDAVPATSGTLRYAINQVNASTDSSNLIQFTPGLSGSITLSSAALPPIINPCTIDGTGATITIDGNTNNYAAFFIHSHTTTLANLTISATANGQPGGTPSSGGGGGGGAGMGGGVLVDTNGTLIINNVSFSGCIARGGAGGSPIGSGTSSQNGAGSGGGGGGAESRGSAAGYGGSYNGGSAALTGGGGGGGGGFSFTDPSNASAATNGAGGSGGSGNQNQGGAGGNGGGTTGGTGAPQTSAGFGGGMDGQPGTNGTANGGGGGGAGGASTQSEGSNLPGAQGSGGKGGSAGDYAGGGGGGGSGGMDGNNSATSGYPSAGSGGAGGFGGGGGGAGYAFYQPSSKEGARFQPNPSSGGNGGFGGGGGGSLGSTATGICVPGTSYWGGGSGGGNPDGGGGGGAGLGGAIFLRKGATLTLGSSSFIGGVVDGGNGGTGSSSAFAMGIDLFVQSGGNLNFAVPASSTLEISSSIDSDNLDPSHTTFVVNNGGTGSNNGVLLLSEASSIIANSTQVNNVNYSIDIENGTLAFSGSGSLPASSTYYFGDNSSTYPTLDISAGSSLITPDVYSTNTNSTIKLGSNSLTFGTSGGTSTYSGGFNGSGTVSFLGSSLTLGGISTGYTGIVNIGTATSVTLNFPFDLGAGAILQQLGGGVITVSTDQGAISMANNLVVNTTTINMTGYYPLTMTGGIGASGTLTITGVNESKFTFSPVSLSNFGNNPINFSNTSTSGTATLELGVTNAFSSAGALNMGSGTTLQASSGTTIAISNAITTSGTLLIGESSDASGTSLTLTGVISGGAAITQNTTGTLTLAPATSSNSFNGITVNSGTLIYGADSAIGGMITLSGGTLQPSASFTTAKLGSVKASTTINVQSYDLIVSSSFTGSGALAISGTSGSGSLGLTNSNSSFSGNISVGTGLTLGVGASNALGTGSVTMGNGSTLETIGAGNFIIANPIVTTTALTVNGPSGTTLTLTGPLTGGAAITKSGLNTLYIAPASSTTNSLGNVNVTEGTFRYGTDNAIGGSGMITVNGATLQPSTNFTTTKINSLTGATIDLQGYNLGINSVISNTGTLTIISSGAFQPIGGPVLTLMQANPSLAGTILIQSGVLNFSANSQIGTASITLAGGGLQAGATFATSAPITVTVPSEIDTQQFTFTINSNINTTFGITAVGTNATPTNNGTLVLAGNNTLGDLTVSENVIVQGNQTGLNAPSSMTITINGLGTLKALSNLTLEQGLVINSNGNAATLDMNTFDVTLNGACSGGAIFSVINAGNLTLNQPGSLSGVMNFSGTSSPTLTLIGSTPIGTATLNAINSMTLDLSSGGATSLLSNPIIIPASVALTVSTGVNLPTLSGVISSSGSLVKTGAGTLILNGVNTYSGGTSLSSGVIMAGNSSALGTGLVTMSDGTTLEVSSSFTLSNSIQLNGSSYINSDLSLGLSGTISGSGAATLIKEGVASLTLSGTNNSYGWNTHVTDGTLNLASANPIGTGTLTLDNVTTLTTSLNGTIVLSNPVTATNFVTINIPANNSLTLSGVVSGTADIEKLGSGILTLSNANGFNGGMAISGGTVVVSNSSSLGSGAILIENDATLQANSSVNLPNDFLLLDEVNFDPTTVTLGVSGTLTGFGTLTKPSSGTLSFTADNSTYSGAIAVLQGTLSGGVNNNPFGTGQINLSGGTTLQASSSIVIPNNILLSFPGNVGMNLDSQTGATFEIDGNISGAGPIYKTSAGRVLLMGAGTYSGGTVISGGTLATGSGNALPSTGNVQINSSGTLDLSTTTQAVTIGNFSGTGLLITGTATEPFTFGGNSLSGGYAFYSGMITGTRPMIKTGSDNYSFTLNSPAYAGQFTINQGIVYINGTFGAHVTVNPGAILRGVSTLGSLVNNGRVSPGNSLGSITVDGNYTQNSNGTLVLEIDAQGDSDMIISGQNVSLDGTLSLSPQPGTYLPAIYHLIHATGAVTGTWSTVSYQSNPLNSAIGYEPQDVYLYIVTPSIIFGDIIGYNPNIMKNYLESYDTTDTGLFEYLTNLDFSSPLIKSAALDLMHPALFGGLGLNKLNISTSLAQFFTRGNPGYCCTDVCLCEDASLWVIPFGQNFHVAGIDQQKGFHSTNLGILGGIDGCVTDYVSLGLSGGFTHSKIKWEMSAGDGTINSYFGALYGDFKANEGYLNVSARAASNSFHCNRHIYFPSYIPPGSPSQIVDFVATNTHSGVDFGTHIGGGYTIRLNHDEFRITPHAEADYFYMQEGGYSEENASYFNLDVKRRDTSYAKASIGLRLSKPIQLEKGCITPLVDLGWANVMPMQGNFFHANLQGISEPFMVRTFTEYWNLLLVSAELSGTITDYTEVSAGYSLETDGHYTSQQLDVRLGVKF